MTNESIFFEMGAGILDPSNFPHLIDSINYSIGCLDVCRHQMDITFKAVINLSLAIKSNVLPANFHDVLINSALRSTDLGSQPTLPEGINGAQDIVEAYRSLQIEAIGLRNEMEWVSRLDYRTKLGNYFLMKSSILLGGDYYKASIITHPDVLNAWATAKGIGTNI